MNYYIQKNQLEDEVWRYRIGHEPFEQDFFTQGANSFLPLVSSWDSFPSDSDPLAKYKFFSINIELRKDLIHINRETYSLHGWVGDCGGLFDGLLVFGELLVTPFASFALRSALLHKIVK